MIDEDKLDELITVLSNYATDEETPCVLADAIVDACVLLHRFEPVKPILVVVNHDYIFKCSGCECQLHLRANYCHGCGRPVKW